MMFHLRTALYVVVLLGSCGCTAQPDTSSLIVLATDPTPWLHIAANSEQRQPWYIGITPLQIQLGQEDQQLPDLPYFLKAQGELALLELLNAVLDVEPEAMLASNFTIEVESWVALDDLGRVTWVFPRYRPASVAPTVQPWRWVNNDTLSMEPPSDPFTPAPFFSQAYNASNAYEYFLTFADFLELGLYDKRVFGDCVWTYPAPEGVVGDGNGEVFYGAWLNLSNVPAVELTVNTTGYYNVCRVVPQPSRFNGKPISWIIPVDVSGPLWPAGQWTWFNDTAADLFEGRSVDSSEGGVEVDAVSSPNVLPPIPATPPFVELIWPAAADFNASWSNTILVLDGEQECIISPDQPPVVFTRKESAQPDNQLLQLAAYLVNVYANMGLTAELMPFVWRDIPQANVLVKIPAVNTHAPVCDGVVNLPVLFADHIDTAFDANYFYYDNDTRISAPGADDNLSGTTTLIQGAIMFQQMEVRCKDIWLVHLTGEEFPGDDLGARFLISNMLAANQQITGLVLLDMIAHVEQEGDTVFQLSIGNDVGSVMLGQTAIAAFNALAADSGPAGFAPEGPMTYNLTPVIRTFFSPYTYLFNTDGVEFTCNGYPVVLFNEHLNWWLNLDRVGYHDSYDNSALINWNFGTSIAKVAIQTVAMLAGGQWLVLVPDHHPPGPPHHDDVGGHPGRTTIIVVLVIVFVAIIVGGGVLYYRRHKRRAGYRDVATADDAPKHGYN